MAPEDTGADTGATNTVSDLADLKNLANTGEAAAASDTQDEAPAVFTPVVSNAPLREQELAP